MGSHRVPILDKNFSLYMKLTLTADWKKCAKNADATRITKLVISVQNRQSLQEDWVKFWTGQVNGKCCGKGKYDWFYFHTVSKTNLSKNDAVKNIQEYSMSKILVFLGFYLNYSIRYLVMSVECKTQSIFKIFIHDWKWYNTTPATAW